MPAPPRSSPSSLDSPNYDPIDHLNAIFSHPSTLASVPAVAASLRSQQDALDAQLAALVRAQRVADASSVARIQAARAELPALFAQIEDVRHRAVATEESIAAMTADIKRLDGTKRNLTLSMTALKRLQMLTTAYEQLRGLGKTRQYRECAQLLGAVVQLVAQFKTYRSIDQIAELHRNIITLQGELLEQVCDDFEKAFAQDEVAQRRGMLAEACQVMDALGDQARQRLVAWYCNTQLREYRQVFRGNDEAGSLDNISRRYSWFNRMIKTYDHDHASIFPPHWRVGEQLAHTYCEGTRDDFKAILERQVRRSEGQPLDVNLLLSCLQETLNFEHGLEKRFIGESRSSVDTIMSRDDRPHSVGNIISEAFEPYMTLWVESQDKQLAKLIPQYKSRPIRNDEEDFSPQAVVPSSTELFHFYRLALAQCAKLSTGSRLQELSKTFAKYLDQYGQQVLFSFLNERSNVTIEDIIVVLNTADYCYQTCNQLEEKIKSRIDEEYKADIDLQSQADSFIGIASAAIRALVRRVETQLEPIWREMRNFPWNKLETVVDNSSYVPELVRLIHEGASDALRYLHKPQYSRAFCDNLVDAIALAYCSNIFQCRPVSDVGAQQMLLDSYTLKKGLMKVPVLLTDGAEPPATFIKRATQSTAKVDSLLKTLQVRPTPPEALVQAYLIHVGDRSETNFRKILELEGIRRADMPALLDLFAAHCQSPANASLPAAAGWLAGLAFGAAAASGGDRAGGAGAGAGGAGAAHALGRDAASSANRFDPATLGNALMNAAREGVDRLGTPTLGGGGDSSSSAAGGGGGGAGGQVGAQAQANINENLQRFGRFFSRDGGFARFGRGE